MGIYYLVCLTNNLCFDGVAHVKQASIQTWNRNEAHASPTIFRKADICCDFADSLALAYESLFGAFEKSPE